MRNAGLTIYSSLRPFAARFQTGLPILTYHKLGPRPHGARLKGLYLSQNLLSKQLRELKNARFRSTSLSDWHKAASARGRQIVVTFDDGFRNVLEFGLEPLRLYGFSAIQFLVAGQLGRKNEWEIAEGEVAADLMDAAQIREWMAAGHDIGAHSLTHPWLTRIPLNQAREEISASKKKLEDTFNRPIQHFCYPYGDWNPAVRDLVAAAGYLTASTVEPGVNFPATNHFSLMRFTARYPSRNLKAIWSRIGSSLKR
jgi:peptidoglycan/xylan/chitin deacetylase (PgdA/CDA1 family)